MRKSVSIMRWILIAFCVIMVAILVTALVMLYQQKTNLTVKVSLQGEAEITLEVGQMFQDPGATAKHFDKRHPETAHPLKPSVKGKVDIHKVGTYELTYSAKYKDRYHSVSRTVRVVDTQAPVIKLHEDDGAFTLPGQPYQEEGYTATDNYDGDLTAAVVAEEKDGMVYYTVTDSSGNTTTANRVIVYGDPEAPLMILKGDAYITMKAGKDFVDPGCSAVDGVMGDMTDAITVEGFVDGYKPGTYKLTYSATDDFGNTGSVCRTVVVLPFDVEDIAEPNGKVIYLTFDDGPGPHTERLLEVLAKYDVKVTFFVVNTAYTHLLTKEAEAGHTVAVHSATHRFDQIYQSEDTYFADFEKMQSIIEQQTGIKTTLLRFPGGSSNTLSADYCKGIMTRLVQAVAERGYYYFDWNVDSNDAGGATTSEQVFRNVIQGVAGKQNSIVLQHDIQSFSVDAVEKIIIWGLVNGYRFAPLTEDSPGSHHAVFN